MDLNNQLSRFLTQSPRIGKGVYIAKTAAVVGDVQLGDYSSVWYQATLRGDINYIRIGRYSNIQDNAVVHLADDYPCVVGDWVTVGHSAVLHACTIGNETLIGMGAIVLDGSVIGDQCLIGAGALITPGSLIPDGSMVLGSPAKVVKNLSGNERQGLKAWADKYVQNAAFCLRNNIQCGHPLAS